MRIAGYIDHPQLKVTIFEMDNRFAVKLENEILEQTYKIRKGAPVNSVEDVRQLITPEFIQKCFPVFNTMRQNMDWGFSELAAKIEEQDFDTII